MSSQHYSNQEVKAIYRTYCFAISVCTGLHGSELGERIAQANRQSYKIVFGDDKLRQADLDEHGLDLITQHRELMISMMLPEA